MKKTFTHFFLYVAVTFLSLPVGAQLATQTFSYSGSIVNFTVPMLCVNQITIEARGAGGGSVSSSQCGACNGGLGAKMVGVITVTPGQVLSILVGQTGTSNGGEAGGGGGSYVATGTVPLIVAGGGGGGSHNVGSCGSLIHGLHATITTTGTASSNGLVAGGTAGNGGGASTGSGGGGGGFYTNGTNGSGNTNSGGKCFLNGGNGGSGTTSNGGFGGGGCGWSTGGNGGGGGGYSGGGTSGGSPYSAGGGGGSFNSGANQVNTASVQAGNGLVVFSYNLGTPLTLVPSATAICTGSSATLTASGMVTYTWSNSSNSNSIVVNPTTTTQYTAQGTNTQGCVSTAVFNLQVNQAVPNLTVVNTASSTSGLCPGRTATITAFGATTYTWTGGITNGQSISVTGTNTYVVTGGNACGTTTAATSLSVHPSPTITATRSAASVCTTQSAVVTGGGGTGSYTIIATSMAVQHGVPFYPFSSQNFTVIGQNALTCTASAQTNIQVVTTPGVPPASTHSLICIGGSFTLSAVGATNYSWFPVPSTVVATSPTIVLSPTVTSTYTMTKSNANCVDTQSITVVVNQLPMVFAVANTGTVCSGTNATLSAGGGISYSWTPGNLPSGSSAANVIVSPQQATTYTLSATDGTCFNTATVTVATYSNPSFTIAMTTTNICSGQSVNYNISAGGNYSYTFANQPLSSPSMTGTSGAVTLTTTTNFIVTASDQNSCVANRQQVVLVNPLPVIFISTDPALNCVNYPTTLTATSGSVQAHSYQWVQGGGGVKSVVNPTVSTTYTVIGTNSVTGCVNTQTVISSVFQPTFSTIKDTAICNKGSVILTASGAQSYTWTGGPKASFYTVSPSVTTVYTVSATSPTINGLKCVSSRTVEVKIYENPTVTATSQRSLVCRGEAVQLFGHGATTYYWPTLNQTGSPVTVSNIQAQLTASVIGTDQFGCKDTNVVTVKFSNCPGFAEYSKSSINVNIFPNPSNGDIQISADVNANFILINELGQTVREISLNEQNGRAVKVTHLSSGVYFLSGEDPGSGTHKVIIQ